MNPLLTLEYHTPHNTFPFSEINPAIIEEAIQEGMALEMKEIDEITSNTEAPSFANTIIALSRSGEILERATTVMYNLLSAETNDELEALSLRVAPLLSDHSSNIMQNAVLFERVKTVYDAYNFEDIDIGHDLAQVSSPVASVNLSEEERMLLKKTYDSFVHSGANLPESKKERFRAIKVDISQLSLQFSQNLIKETNGFRLHITNEEELEGLPNSQRRAAAAVAREEGKDGWIFTLHAPSLHPFLQYSARRELRQKLFMAANTRCTHDNEYNNYEICRSIINLRQELAQLLGYSTYADYVLKNRMAQNIMNVNTLFDQLIDIYLPIAKEEVRAVEDFARQVDSLDHIEPWDFVYYSHHLKKRDYNVDEEMLRPYFSLDRVVEGVFGLAQKLYGIRFSLNESIPVYHTDVKAYEVFDNDGLFLAVLYTDFFPRPSKQNGAWMTSYREQFIDEYGDHRPHVSLTMNFTKPVPASDDQEGSPSLLTLSEVETFLHEFGHALHGIFSHTHYSCISGTNVYWDFVELPSQFMENFALQSEFLQTFAYHYKTGEVIPSELIDRIRRSRNFNVAYACMRQVGFGLLDMSFYTRTTPLLSSISSYEKNAQQRVQLLPTIEASCMTVQFGHIISGGYAAGYYSYKWAEVLDADAFEAFLQHGIFSPTVANDFRHKLLSKGGTLHPATLYRDFRGHDASIDALLRRDGIKANCPISNAG